MANTEKPFEYDAPTWSKIMQHFLSGNSGFAIAMFAEDHLHWFSKNPEHPQAVVLELISSCNDLDVIHRTCANELGLTEKVKELDDWIARKPPRRRL